MARLALHLLDEFTAPPLPLRRWAFMAAIAVGGSLVYGTSLALTLPGWTRQGAALWLTLSAGLAWCVFIPTLWLSTNLSWSRCFDACLVAMVAGEVVLTSGAAVNVLLWWQVAVTNAAVINAGIVGLSNVVMLTVLAGELRRERIAIPLTAALWMVALNGSGAVFFALLHHLLHTP